MRGEKLIFIRFAIFFIFYREIEKIYLLILKFFIIGVQNVYLWGGKLILLTLLPSIGKQVVYLFIIIWDLSPVGGQIPIITTPRN